MSIAPETTSASSANVRSTKQRLEFPYLDGMRGAAALVVVVYHAFLFTGKQGDAPRDLPLIGAVVSRGYLGVPVFIVLSGYVLMLPLVTRALGQIDGPEAELRLDLRRFVKRRARRILPPYYAALLISVLLIMAVPVMRHRSGTQWDTKLPVTTSDVVSHVFLVHDFSSAWIGSINGPLWSVAVEWHIYFLMPLLILPLWRVIGARFTTGLLLGLALIPLATGADDFMHPWLVGLFAAGMWAAQVSVQPQAGRHSGRWAAVTGGLAVVVLGAGKVVHGVPPGAFEVVVGVAVACLLAWAGRRTLADQRVPVGLRPLASRPFMRLGLFSYSIYLLHSPLLALANLLLRPMGWSTLTTWSVLTFLVVPVVIAVCYGFFWLVESRCLNSRQRHAVAELAPR